MPRILLFLACAAALPAMAKDPASVSRSPEVFIQRYFNVFNGQNEIGLDTIFTKPFLRIKGGKTIAYSDWRDYIDYQAIMATGWDRSVINHIEIVYDADDTAAMKTLFSRLDKEGKIVARAEVLFITTKQNGVWKLASILLPPGLPVSKSD